MSQLSLSLDVRQPATIELRKFQRTACLNVWKSLAKHRSTLLVAPTGAGKTVMGMALLGKALELGHRCLVMAHRIELIRQTADRIRNSSLGGYGVGIIAPGWPAEHEKGVQVGSIQSLLNVSRMPSGINFLVLDEAHHYVADEWRQVVERLPGVHTIGLTATPARTDGKPLGDIFEDLVVAANYSELVRDGYLTRARVLAPERTLDSGEAAQHPLDAYRAHAMGLQTFGFTDRVDRAFALASDFTDTGIPSAVIEANTPKGERLELLDRFKNRDLKVLWNVATLTEGIDVPEASCAIIDRKMDSILVYLQACGRVLRTSLGKTEALILDLTGASLLHGSPTEDRFYSLTGTAISRVKPASVRLCISCGHTSSPWTGHCPVCGFEPPQLSPNERRILNEALQVAEQMGALSPKQVKDLAYRRLREEAQRRERRPSVVVARYRKLFGEHRTIDDATPIEKREEYLRLDSEARKANFKPGWIAYRFRDIFGHWPQRGMDY